MNIYFDKCAERHKKQQARIVKQRPEWERRRAELVYLKKLEAVKNERL